jgi:hypothetical protein
MKKEGFRRKTTFEKKKESRPCRLGHGSTRQLDRVLPGFYTGQYFALPELVQPPGPESTNQVSPGLITMVIMISIPKQIVQNLYFFPSSVWLIMHRMGENHNQSESLNCSIHNLFRFVFYGVITISNKHHDIWLIINFASSIFFLSYH